MENLVNPLSFAGAFAGRSVLVTGHTGFKGSWLTEWLLALGARVTGFSLPPPTQPALFEQLGLERRLTHREGDVRDYAALHAAVREAQPDFVFHLAAQPLVRLSYEQPVATYATNVMGTVHLLEALRQLAHPCGVVIVTTDKCYENREWVHGYREEDPLGGHDPYSSSKGAAELVVAAYRRSYFSTPPSPIRVATARAGNVIGGGDWATDRIVPDCIRALSTQQPVIVRNQHATRPWQHVLEPLSGYLWLGVALANAGTPLFPAPPETYASAFNFGPERDANRTVAQLVEAVLRTWPGRWEDRSDPSAPHEASYLFLSTDKAHRHLHWRPVWSFAETVQRTTTWYRTHASAPAAATALVSSQIADYAQAARALGCPWATCG